MPRTSVPPGDGLLAIGAGGVLGTALQLQQAAVWPTAGAVALGLAAVAAVTGLACCERGRRAVVALAGLLAGAAIGFALTDLRAGARLAEALPAALEGRDLQAVGSVSGLPQRGPDGWRLRFELDAATLDGRPVDVPRQLALGWGAADGADLPALRAGQRWALTLRLKRPHGTLNPWGYDYELQLFEQGVRATGQVRAGRDTPPRLLAAADGHRIDRARQAVREAIVAQVGDGSAAGVLAALAVGDQAAIGREGWALYRQTGVAHLMSISGLHVTMFAWLAGAAIGAAWRRWPRGVLAWPAPAAARWGGLLAACGYALFAGWGVPAQRTVLMLAVAIATGAAGLRWRAPQVWVAALAAVSLLDPWALRQAGFWLSFGAVALLMASGEAHVAPQPAARAPVARWRAGAARLRAAAAGGLRTQAIATLGLAPLTLVFFQQISLVGFVANLVAIPLITLLVTPVSLLGVLAPPCWTVAAVGVDALDALLRPLAAPGWAVWSAPAAPPWAVACGLAGAALAMLPLPVRLRLLGLPPLLPLLWPAVPRPAPGAFDLIAVDVGQGTAVVLRTAGHTLLYDTGPQYSRQADAGERVLLPLLRALGEPRLDTLVLSHRDTDHVGGAAALLRGLPVRRLASSLAPAHPLRALAVAQGADVVPCTAGGRWTWDGVQFEWLHPDAERLATVHHAAARANTLSCVLRVQGRWGGAEHAVLLPGDLERDQEAALVARDARALASEVLLVPHHGSRTSSSAAFLDAVAPRVAVVQAGYRNRFGHPAPEVLARYAARGIAVVDSPTCGAWRYGPAGAHCWRAQARRYWHHPDTADPHNGVEVANPAGPELVD